MPITTDRADLPNLQRVRPDFLHQPCRLGQRSGLSLQEGSDDFVQCLIYITLYEAFRADFRQLSCVKFGRLP